MVAALGASIVQGVWGTVPFLNWRGELVLAPSSPISQVSKTPNKYSGAVRVR